MERGRYDVVCELRFGNNDGERAAALSKPDACGEDDWLSAGAFFALQKRWQTSRVFEACDS